MTAIVVGMAFSVLGLVRRQLHGIRGNYERGTELNLLRRALWLDLNRTDAAMYDPGTATLSFDNGQDGPRYRFARDHVARDLDTFWIGFAHKRFFFAGNPRESGEVDALHLMATGADGHREIFTYKMNSATSYMNDRHGL